MCGRERIQTTWCDYRAEGKINKRNQGREPDYSVGVVTRLGSVRRRSRSSPCRGRFFFSAGHSERFSDPPSLFFKGYRLVFSVPGRGGVKHTTFLHLMPRLMLVVIPPLPSCVSIACTTTTVQPTILLQFIPLWCTCIMSILTYVLPSATRTFSIFISICYMFRSCIPSSGLEIWEFKS